MSRSLTDVVDMLTEEVKLGESAAQQLAHVKKAYSIVKDENAALERALKFWRRRADAYRGGLVRLVEVLESTGLQYDRTIYGALQHARHLLADERLAPSTVVPREDGSSDVITTVPDAPAPARATFEIHEGDATLTYLRGIEPSLQVGDEVEVTVRLLSRVVTVTKRVRFLPTGEPTSAEPT